MDDPARAYLTRVIDWADVAAGKAWVNIHYTKQDQQDNKTSPWWGYSSTTIDEALQQVAYLTKTQKNVFLRQATTSEVQEAASGGGFRRAVKRLQSNSHNLRTFFFDLDVKEGGYADTTEAWADVFRVCGEAQLPPPQVIVLSGSGGLHIYWVLDHAIAPAVWKPLAMTFIRLLEHHGLKFDRQCSSDSVRLLRVPGSINWKGGVPKPVQLAAGSAWIDEDYTLDRMRGLLEAWAKVNPPSNVVAMPGVDLSHALAAAQHGIVAPLGVRPAIADTGEFSQGVERGAGPVDLARVVDYCGVFGDAAATGGLGHVNGLWHQLIYNATFGGESGRAYAHAMSNQDPRYTAAETDLEFDRAVAVRAADTTKGWSSCSAFADYQPAKCQACPLAGKIAYPLAIGAGQAGLMKVSQILGPAMAPSGASAAIQPSAPPAANATAAPGALPVINWPYYRNPAGIWRVGKVNKKTGEEEPAQLLIPYDLVEAWLENHPAEGNRLTMVFELPHGRRGIVVILGAKKTPADVDGAFGLVGIALHAHQIENVRGFVVDFMQQLQRDTVNISNNPPFGWVEDGLTYKGFAFDGAVHGAPGVAAGSGDSVTMSHYKPSGTFKAWQDAAQYLVDAGRQDLNTILAAAFAAPIVEFSGQPGLYVSAYSAGSGVGKTTAMRIAQAVWAKPDVSMNAMDDTTNSVLMKAGMLKNLPLFWDELKGKQAVEKFVPMVFSLTQGKGKSRMNSNMGQREVGTWRTILVSASNLSTLDLVTEQDQNNDPGVVRTFEFTVERAPHTVVPDQVAINNLFAGVLTSYGHAGLKYAEWLGLNHAKAKQLYDDTVRAIYKRVGHHTVERFWIATMAVLLNGAMHATSLGIVRFDINALFEFLCATLTRLRSTRKIESTTIDTPDKLAQLIGQYHGEIQKRFVLETDVISRITTRGRPPAKTEPLQIYTDLRVLDSVRMHIGREDRIMRIDLIQFKAWMYTKGIQPRPVLEAMASMLGGKELQALMGQHTPVAREARVRAVEISLDALHAAGMPNVLGPLAPEVLEVAAATHAVIVPGSLADAEAAARGGITT